MLEAEQVNKLANRKNKGMLTADQFTVQKKKQLGA